MSNQMSMLWKEFVDKHHIANLIFIPVVQLKCAQHLCQLTIRYSRRDLPNFTATWTVVTGDALIAYLLSTITVFVRSVVMALVRNLDLCTIHLSYSHRLINVVCFCNMMLTPIAVLTFASYLKSHQPIFTA